MNLKEYYKTHLYEYAYNKGFDDGLKNTPKPTGDMEDIYWQDEMDYILCADYYSCFVGGFEDWSDEDLAFLRGLGFEPEDFEMEDADE